MPIPSSPCGWKSVTAVWWARWRQERRHSSDGSICKARSVGRAMGSTRDSDGTRWQRGLAHDAGSGFGDVLGITGVFGGVGGCDDGDDGDDGDDDDDDIDGGGDGGEWGGRV